MLHIRSTLFSLAIFLPSVLSAQTMHKVGKDYVHHTTETSGKCRDLRAAYYPTFQSMTEVFKGSSSASSKGTQITSLEARLPTRVEIRDTMIRSHFTRPHAETDIWALKTAASYGSTSGTTLYHAMPGVRSQATRVSPFFDILYDEKEKYFLKNIRMVRNGFYPWTIIYDCDTVLEIGEPSAPVGQRMLFFHSDLDIDADGSDGARHGDPREYSKDGAFQPETSYRWSEEPTVPNPFLKKWQTRKSQAEERIRILEKQLAEWRQLQVSQYGHQVDEDIAGINTALEKYRYQAQKAEGRIRDITKMRHLVGELDPFIVIPLSWTYSLPDKYRGTAYEVKVGDYALVLYGQKVYPCIVADEGPYRKTGEASLALAEQIRRDNTRLQGRKLTAENSCFWDLEVSYMVFPGTAAPKSTWGIPDLAKWNKDCAELIEGMGGLAKGFTMHRW